MNVNKSSMMSKDMEKKINRKSLCLCVSIVFWMALCMGLLFTMYYDQFEVKINVMVKNTNNSYMAAVVDYAGFYEKSYQRDSILNLYQYVNIIQQAARYMIDIIVFPECGLFMCDVGSRDLILKYAVFVPSAEELAIPCDNYIAYDDVISKLSCAAKAANMYVAVNLWEKFYAEGNCTSEPLLYNTAVVFDRSGMIVARYRKYNLFTERWLDGVNQTQTPELVTFETDFGETFGIMICYDVFFKEPGVTLVKEKNVTSVIHLAALMSRLPFLASASVEAGWSYAMNVNLLASNLPSKLSFCASNIYFGRNEQPNTYMMDYGYSKIIMAAVPKNGAKYMQSEILESGLPKYSAYGPKDTIFVTEPTLNLSQSLSLFDSTLKNGSIMGLERNEFHYTSAEFDCTVSVVWKNDNITTKPNYQMLAYSGKDDFTIASVNNYVEMCGLILCSSKQNQYCEMPPEFQDSNKITVMSVNIVATSRKSTSVTIPIALDSMSLPLNASRFSFNSFLTRVGEHEEKFLEMNLEHPMNDLVTFGMYTLPKKSTPLQISNPPLEWLEI